MAGYLVGSMLMTWILCSALNAMVEGAALRQWINRGVAFVCMLAGVVIILLLMAALAAFGLPDSTLALDEMTPQQVSNSMYTGLALNVLLALGYCGFQLRRFWGDD